jgi:hypothetical protein
MFGIFLHTSNTPETVRELLSRIGVSVSPNAINEALSSLSKEAEADIRLLGRTHLASYAYDNLDIDLKHSVPTIENPHDTLVHLTTGTMLPLYHGVTLQDLDCSDLLWKSSENNHHGRRQDLPLIETEHLLMLHQEAPHPSNLLRRERFNAWKFLHDLVWFGPEYFHKFRTALGDPEEIECIPVIKTQQVPNRSLDLSPNAPAQNAEAIEALLRQAGIGDPSEDPRVETIGNRTILIFGDLLTGERIRSLLDSRSEETTPWRRMQFVVYVMGLFHLKMACADAIWRIFIRPTKARDDENSLMQQISQIRPKETGKIASKPGFRRMHEVIQHVGIVSRLDCWRIEAGKDSNFQTLEEFASSKPSWDKMEAMATQLALEQVATSDSDATLLQSDQSADQDHQRENTLRRQQYFLLYEEISHALNAGDIGRVETCFMPWSYIFQGCGKHKYAAELRRYLENVHFVYPKGLAWVLQYPVDRATDCDLICNRNAIRMNILCNPTGKKGKFRAIDWLVEHNNLYIKVSKRYHTATSKSHPGAADLRWEVLKPPEAADSQRVPPDRDI